MLHATCITYKYNYNMCNLQGSHKEKLLQYYILVQILHSKTCLNSKSQREAITILYISTDITQ